MSVLAGLSFLLAAVLPAGYPGHSIVDVTALDSSGADDPLVRSSVAQALSDVGASVMPARDFPNACGSRCMRVSVRSVGEDQYSVEVLSGARVIRLPLRFSGAASRFDRAHALAIQVEMLTESARDTSRGPARRSPSRSAAPATPATPTAPVAAPACLAKADPPETAGEPETAAGTPALTGPFATAAVASTPGHSEQSPVLTAATPAPRTAKPTEHLSLDVAATVLTGLSGEMLQEGLALGARIPVRDWIDVRAGGSLLRNETRSAGGVQFRRELLPLDASTTLALPWLPGIRAGAGLQAFLLTGDVGGADGPYAWSFGTTGTVEYRHAVRSFVLTSAVQALFHPLSWRTSGQDDPMVAVPVWSLGVSLGLEFNVF